MNESIDAYLAFLWAQFQYDWSVFSNPWYLYTVIPVVLYILFFFVKWWILLAPITVPLTVLCNGLSSIGGGGQSVEKDKVKSELERLTSHFTKH